MRAALGICCMLQGSRWVLQRVQRWNFGAVGFPNHVLEGCQQLERSVSDPPGALYLNGTGSSSNRKLEACWGLQQYCMALGEAVSVDSILHLIAERRVGKEGPSWVSQ